MEELTLDTARALLPPRGPEDHKGTYGHLFVLAGARGYTGAAKLASLATARAGAGLVTCGTPAPLWHIVASAVAEIMTHPLPATDDETFAEAAAAPALAFAKGKSAAVVGPGLTRHPDTVRFVQRFCQQSPVPFLADADALNALSEDTAVLKRKASPCVLTPHPGEMARLTGRDTKDVIAHREELAPQFAQAHDCILVLKGRRTLVAAPDGRLAANTTGNEGLATGGTGDVLSGIIGSFLAQGLPPFDAARLGVYLHGLAGDVAAERMTRRAMIAGDVIDAIPEAFRRLEHER